MRTPVGLAVAALMAWGAAQAFAPRETPPLHPTRLAVDRMQINALSTSKAGLLAAGELGTLLHSSDAGQHWQRATVSADRQAPIVQIAVAPDGLEGMAVGHEGWILRTEDGGVKWTEVAFDEKNGEPLMGIAKMPSGAWIAVGAFGRALQSDPQGRHWQPLALPASVGDKHLNRIVGSADGKNWLVVGERGLVLRSSDGGASWTETAPFYDGSLYNALALPNGGWLVYGMRGNIFRSAGEGAPWVRSDMPVPVSFFGHTVQPDGKIILVGQGSLLATSSDGGQSFTLGRFPGRASLTDIVLTPKGTGWLASDAGLHAYPAQPPAPARVSGGAQ